MRFICDNCKTKYSIADNKIKKKVLKIRCKKCSHIIIVRDTAPKPKPTASVADTANSPLSRSNLAAVLSSPSQTSLPQASAPLGPAHQEEADVGERTVVARISADWLNQLREEKKEDPIWFMALQGSPVGPVVLSDVLSRIKNQELKEEDLVWCAGWANWIPANTVQELKTAFSKVQAPSIAPPPPVKQQTKPAPQPSFAQTKPAPQPSFAQTKPAPQPSFAPSSTSQPTEDSFSSATQSDAREQSPSPLAALAESSSPTQSKTPLNFQEKHNIGHQGQALHTPIEPATRDTPTDILTGAATIPQPELSELTPSPAQPKPSLETFQQAEPEQKTQRPAVEFIETNAEENFFDNGTPHRTSDSDDDLFEIALPPLPNWEAAEEVDADDIIEMSDAIKPSWTRRLGLIGGALAAIFLFSMGMSKLLGAFETPVQTQTAQKTESPSETHQKSSAPTRTLGATGSALLGVKSAPKKPKVPKRNITRKRPIKRKKHRVARQRVIRVKPKKSSTNTDLQALIRQQYLAKLGQKALTSKNQGIRGTTTGSQLSPRLEKRIYSEIARNQVQVKYCYEQYLKKAYIQGRMYVKFRIEPDGSVSDVSVLTRRFKSLAITRCIVRKMRRWHFTSFTGTPFITMTIPFVLKTTGF